MTYNVFGGTLSLTQSINQSTGFVIGENEQDMSACSCSQFPALFMLIIGYD